MSPQVTRLAALLQSRVIITEYLRRVQELVRHSNINSDIAVALAMHTVLSHVDKEAAFVLNEGRARLYGECNPWLMTTVFYIVSRRTLF